MLFSFIVIVPVFIELPLVSWIFINSCVFVRLDLVTTAFTSDLLISEVYNLRQATLFELVLPLTYELVVETILVYLLSDIGICTVEDDTNSRTTFILSLVFTLIDFVTCTVSYPRCVNNPFCVCFNTLFT